MAGNRNIFNDAIKKGHNAAWDGQWKKAAEEYRRALAEFPDDHSVRSSLAHALEETGQWESALAEYRNLAQAHPGDPIPLTRVAALLEKLRQPAEAAGSYLALADIYLETKQGPQAIEAWKKAAALEPDRTDVHLKLAEVYSRSARVAAAAGEYLALARIYQKRGDSNKALSAAQQALTIDPRNKAAAVFIDDIKRIEAPAAPPVNVVSPMNQAEKTALSRLAETLLEEPAQTPPVGAEEHRHLDSRPQIDQVQVDALIARAVDAQMHHRVSEAIEAYQKLMSTGITRAEVKFNLGLLYFETMRYDDAMTLLSETVNDSDYALASHYALGQCYRARGKMDSAVEHFMQVTRIVDLGSVRRDQADELISVYEGLAESYAAKGDSEQAESFSKALEEFLSSKGWEDKVHEVRHHLEALRKEGGQLSLAEVIEVPDSDKVLEALALSQEYVRRGKLGAASEECLRAIQMAPGYLPGHVRLAETLVKQEHLEQANVKYQTLAELYAIRGDSSRAEAMYHEALQIVPDDVVTRSKLIDLLLQQNKHDSALEQYLALGEEYARAGQSSKAMEKFMEGTRLAQRTNNTSPFATSLRHRIAELKLRQGDFKAAFAAYQEIRQQSPEDERARFYVVDLEFRLGQPNAGLRDLEDLISRYQTRNEPHKATAVLEALAQNYPNEVGLAMRLAQLHVENGATEKAIAVLDALGEAQLSAGQKEAAAVTIRRIIELSPPRLEDYQKLLESIGE